MSWEMLVQPDNSSWRKAEDTGGLTDVASCERNWKWGCARSPEAGFKLGTVATQGLGRAVRKGVGALGPVGNSSEKGKENQDVTAVQGCLPHA